MIHLSHPTGNRNVREALTALDEAGMLGRFTTPIAWRGGFWGKVLPKGLVSNLERRTYDPSILAKTLTHPTKALAGLIASRGPLRDSALHQTGALSFDAVLQDFDAWVSRHILPDAQAVHCYEDSALQTFKAAKGRKIKRVYEHPVGYWRYVEKLFAEERELKPGYLSILPGLNDSAEKRARKDEEIGLADLLLLSSSYSEKSLKLFPGTLPPVAIIPYGAPSELVAAPTAPSEKLRVAFVGGLSQIKGISYLVESLTQVQDLVEVTVIGRRVGDCAPLDNFLKTINWIESIPHAEVLNTLRRCDVLILPSLSDGFGLVVLEAMSQGLTAIVSDHAGVSDVIEHGVNGFVTPVRNVSAIVGHLETLAANPELLTSLKQSALETAARYTWNAYRSKLIDAYGALGLTSPT